MNRKILIHLCLLIFPIFSIAQPTNQNNNEVEQILIFTSNFSSASEEKKNSLISLIQQQYDVHEKKVYTVFVGNTFDLKKHKATNAKARKEQEKAAVAPFKLFQKYDDEAAFVPGNKEWLNNDHRGWENVQYVEQVIENYVEENIFMPNIGCPAPEEVELGGDVLLLLLNTPWYFHHWEKPIDRSYECEAGGKSKFFRMIDEVLEVNQEKKVIIAGFHSIYGGNKNIGDPSKSHYEYVEFRREMEQIFAAYDNVIYVSGNERGQQYIPRDNDHHIIVSAVGNNAPAQTTGDIFSSGNSGPAKITVYKNGTVDLEFHVEGNASYQKRLYWKQPIPDPEEKFSDISDPADYSDSTIVLPASDKYHADGFKRLLLGNHYRTEWLEPVEVKLLDLKNYKGGLIPVQQGGGQQTKSLRFMAGDGYIYNTRSVEKDPSKVLPDQFSNTFARSIVQDQISTAHPYGALAIPPLAKAAGIYHLEPELVYIPNSPILGRYRNDFGNMLATIELRPDEDLSAFDKVGNSENVVSTRTMTEDVTEDNDNEVDSRLFLRSRIFDLWVGDWDRHEDQWRWAEQEKPEGGIIFEPVPRDRDQVFVKFDGLIPYLATRRWAVQNLEHFGHNYGDIASAMYSGTYLDRRFLTGLSREDWREIADSLKNALTDNVIEQAIQQLPKGASTKNNQEIIDKLKSRRDDLVNAAMKYYSILAKEVDVPGSNKHEHYLIERLPGGDTKVTMYKTSKEGEVRAKLYERTFLKNETNEIRLYGLDGNDSFVVTGTGSPKILVRMIGSEGNDVVVNNSGSGKLKYYDHTGYRIEGEKVKREIYDEPRVNEYDQDRKPMKYDYVAPAGYFGFNRDDGIFIGGGVNIKTFGWRKDPFATSHYIVGNYAFLTQAFNLRYSGIFTKAIGTWDFLLDLDGNFPNYVGNFFGYGNETTYNMDTSISYYRARYDLFTVAPALGKKFNEMSSLRVGPYYQFTKLEDHADRFIGQTEINGLDPDHLFDRNHYAGVVANYTFDTRNSTLRTFEGTFFNIGGSYNYDITNSTRNFTKFFGDISFYLTKFIPVKTTLAVRVGGATNFGDFNFYQANYLGGTENLRGYREDRFAGRSSIYQNTDLRIHLFNLSTYLLSGDVGILGFNDFGRVWIDNEDSDELHHGYGGGIWIAPFNVAVVSATYGISKEEALIYVKFGFLF